MKPQRLTILHEDRAIVVIDKPCGLLSVPYPGSSARTAQDILEQMLRSRGSYSAGHRPLAVHRLDRDTSGVMMFALTAAMHKKIMATWHDMVTERLYHAVAENPRNPRAALPECGLIDDPLAQNRYHRGYVPHPHDTAELHGTVPARTRYTILATGATHSLFELSLDTGKKNQIRAHLASKGYPLAGDRQYRTRTDPFGRLALHARTLAFAHPVTGEPLRFEVPEPAEWRAFVLTGQAERQQRGTGASVRNGQPHDRRHQRNSGRHQ